MSDTQTNTQQNTQPKISRLIGSQRNPEAYRPKPNIEVVGDAPPKEEVPNPNEASEEKQDNFESPGSEQLEVKLEKRIDFPTSSEKISVPKLRNGKMSDDLEDEFNAIFGSQSVDNLLNSADSLADAEVLEPDTKLKAKVIAVRGESVFLDIGAREQGVVSLKMFPPDAEPKSGDSIDVTVLKFLRDEGLYEVSVPLAAADVRDWSQVHEGMIVEARVTKTNSGGLECEVNRLRGFIPISQIEMFRVENIEPYIGQKLTCVVEEVNPERRNLVLSRRSMLYREREEKRVALLAELAVGQIREGLVRKIIDAGAFVDLGGVDGFIPISAMSWGRINHPSDVLTEGTRIKVRVARIDEDTNRISLVYRDDASNPWSNIEERFQPKTLARGKVTKIMEFGAFIELMPGVEGLVHISELANKRVNNVREIVKEGDWVDVYIISIDPAARKMSLSIKQAAPVEVVEIASPTGTAETPEKEEQKRPPIKTQNAPKGPLKGGTGESGQSSSGEKFGLNW